MLQNESEYVLNWTTPCTKSSQAITADNISVAAIRSWRRWFACWFVNMAVDMLPDDGPNKLFPNIFKKKSKQTVV